MCVSSPRLFPLQEPGVNSEAATLTKEEIQVRKKKKKSPSPVRSGPVQNLFRSCCTLSHSDSSPAFFLQRFLGSSTAKEHLFKSYVLMLDFYGIELSDEKTGEVKRSPNWEERFRNLNT